MKRFIQFLNISFYSLITLFAVIWLIKWHHTSLIVYIHTINFFILWILGFELSKKLGLKYVLERIVKAPFMQIKYLLLGLVLHVCIHPFYAGLTGKTAATYEFKWSHLYFGPYLAKNLDIILQIIMIGLLTLLAFSIYRGYQKSGTKMFIQVAKYSIVPIVLIASFFTINHYSTKDFYLKFDEEPKSVQALISHRELKEKYLYVDFWNSGCGPCIKDFKKYEQFLKTLPKSVRDNVAFVFIGVDRNTPGELSKQKHFIKKLNIEAKHYFIPKSKLYKWWNELNPNERITPQFSYYYLINPKGEIEIRNGPKIGDDLKSLLIKKTT